MVRLSYDDILQTVTEYAAQRWDLRVHLLRLYSPRLGVVTLAPRTPWE